MTESQPHEIRTYFAPAAYEIAVGDDVVNLHYDLEQLERASEIATAYKGRSLPDPIEASAIVFRFAYYGAGFRADRARFDRPFHMAIPDSQYYAPDQLGLPEQTPYLIPTSKTKINDLGSVHEISIRDFSSATAMIRCLGSSLVSESVENLGFSPKLVRAWARGFKEAVVPTRGPDDKLHIQDTLRNEAISRIVAECSQAIRIEKRNVQ